MTTETEYKVPNAYVLAGMAVCASPDTIDSPGARFLGLVADSVVQLMAPGIRCSSVSTSIVIVDLFIFHF